MPGSSCTLRASNPAVIIAAASIAVPATFKPLEASEPDSADACIGSSSRSADRADTTMSTCCECELPIHGTRMKLVTSEPAMAPTVFAAYTPPARRAASWSSDATAASAIGKLAPQRMAPGRTTQKQRTRSSCSVYQGELAIDGLIGQYGSDSVFMYAAQAIAPHKSS